MMDENAGLYAAIEDFRSARRQAALEQIVARLTGKSVDLLSYEDVREKLRVKGQSEKGLHEIPLDAIVGSVGRYGDFTRSFLPRKDSDEDRWAKVKRAVASLEGVPPIQVYQIGEAYFVFDGNHRVSVARQLGATHMEAYVTELQTTVPLSPEDDIKDIVLKAEYADFLENTHLDELRPEADLQLTLPGQYPALYEHINVHRHFMGLAQQRYIPYEEAAAHWYDEVYLPVVEVIREQDLLRGFPERTEADLYMWAAEHRAELGEKLEWEVTPGAAVVDLAAQARSQAEPIVARVGEKILDAMVPDELEGGPPAGEWRTTRLSTRRDARLFADILVAVNGEESGWHALAQALEIARREGSRLMGLHVLLSEEETVGQAAQAVQAEFLRRCEAAGVQGKLVLTAGKVARTICERARWTDLVVLSLRYPPPAQPLGRLGSGFRTLLRRCPRPVLAVPGGSWSMERPLLAYDGSPKAREALFVATYLAGRWSLALTVVTVLEKGRATSETLTRARTYLRVHGVHATCVARKEPASEAILAVAEAQQSDLIIMGGYGHSPVMEVMLGSTVDRVLRSARQPTLVCR